MATEPTSQPVRPRRFYDSVAVASVDEGYRIELDGRIPKSTGGKELIVPAEDLARLIAREWDAQDDRIDLAQMPLTRLANRAIDCTDIERHEMISDTLRFSVSDLLAYRAPGPDPLVRLQTEKWDPLLEWAWENLGARFIVTDGLASIEQPDACLEALREQVSGLDTFELAGLSPAVALLGSIVLGLALFSREITSKQALELSLLEELWQVEQWGRDEEAETRRLNLSRDLGHLQTFLGGLTSGATAAGHQ